MEEFEFKIGDVVNLKNHLTDMVISDIDGAVVTCIYFNKVEGKFTSYDFPISTLVKPS